MPTTNLGLKEIILDDRLKNEFIEKLNFNMQKVDEKYGELKASLLKQTNKNTLAEAIDYVQDLADKISSLKAVGTATASQILAGKSAMVKGTVITGSIPSLGAQTITPSTSNKTIASGQYLSGVQTIQGDANLVASNILSGKSIFGVTGNVKKQPTINITLSGDYASQISGYGAGIDQNGNLVIWAMTNTTTYEAVSFSFGDGNPGSKGVGWDITSFDTSNPSNVPYACTVTGLNNYTLLNISLYAESRNASYDYTGIRVVFSGISG